MRVLLSTVATLAIALALSACGGGEPTSAPAPTPTTPPAETPSETPPPPATPAPTSPPSEPTVAPLEWIDSEVVVELGDGWSATACEGDAVQLCLVFDGVTVGAVEAVTYPLASLPFLDPAADDESNLAAIAADFIDSFVADRAVGCPEGYVVDPLEPEPIALGEATGLRFGFAGTLADGTPSELIVQYATVVGDDLLLMTASAYDEGGCPGRDDLSGFDTASLEAVLPLLDAALAGSPLPPASGVRGG